MLAVIFAGGLGTRISEDSHLRPKVMTEVAERAAHARIRIPVFTWYQEKYFNRLLLNNFIYKCKIFRTGSKPVGVKIALSSLMHTF